MSSATRAVVAMAPKGAFAIIHIDPKSVTPVLEKVARELTAGPGDGSTTQPAASHPAGKGPQDAILAVNAVLHKTDTLDVYAVMGENGPSGLAVFRTPLKVVELVDLINKSIPDAIPQPVSTGNGRYSFGEGAPGMVIDGKEASDVDDALLLAVMGSAGQAQATIHSLKAGPGEKLSALLSRTDTSAPIWAAADLSALGSDDGEAPLSAVVMIFPDGTKKSTVLLEFAAEEPARKFQSELSTAIGGMLSILGLSAQRQDAEVTVSFTLDGGFAGRVSRALATARMLATRAASATNLMNISAAVEMYKSAHEGKSPANLMVLAKDGAIGAQALVHPGKPRQLRTDAKGVPVESGDYVYVLLPADAPEDLVRVYEPVELNNGEGANVLFVDGHVQWLKPDEFKAALKKTKTWLTERK